MALLNPVHGLVVPFLCVFTVPLAIFAGITSALAFSVLMFRVAAVYVDIALGMIPQYFTGRSKSQMLPDEFHRRRQSRDGFKTPISPAGSVGSSSDYSTPTGASPFRHGSGYKSPATRRRKSSYGFGAALRHSSRSSQVSLGSRGTITPINEDEVAEINETFVTPSSGMDRDFEGVGGWRLDDQDDDGNWTNINSRLELPVETRGSQSRASRHSHQRSQSLGPFTPSETTWLTSTHIHGRNDQSPDRERWKRFSSGSGTRSPGKLLISPGSRRLSQHIQLPDALTSLDPNNGYFPDLISPRSERKPTT
ncbi:hypothetical protein OQA88_7800 [Cercophora sp. LCS_1]